MQVKKPAAKKKDANKFTFELGLAAKGLTPTLHSTPTTAKRGLTPPTLQSTPTMAKKAAEGVVQEMPSIKLK